MNKLCKIFHAFFCVNWIKTIIFNIHYFNLETAIKLPVFIYHRTTFNRFSGSVKIDGSITMGMIRIGIPIIGYQDKKYSRTIWEVFGNVLFNGVVFIGRGSKICVEKEGSLIFGRNARINGDSTIICNNKIVIGDNCLLSWDVLIMDNDHHSIYVIGETSPINQSEPILIGNHVWIGCRCIVLKGVIISSESVIGAGSIVSRALSEKNCVYGGVGKDFRIIKQGIHWR